MEELEFYFLAKDRSLDCINKYLDKYAPERVPLSKNYIYPEFSDEPEIQFLNPNELMLKLVSEGSGSYSLYWQFYNSRLSQVMVIFLKDAGLVLGGVTKVMRKSILEEFGDFMHNNYYYISLEEHPPSTIKEFIDLCEKYRKNRH